MVERLPATWDTHAFVFVGAGPLVMLNLVSGAAYRPDYQLLQFRRAHQIRQPGQAAGAPGSAVRVLIT